MNMKTYPTAKTYYDLYDIETFLMSLEDLNQNDVREFVDLIQDSGVGPGSMTFLKPTQIPRLHPKFHPMMDAILGDGFIKDEDGDVRVRIL
jgi:hypothetical protein